MHVKSKASMCTLKSKIIVLLNMTLMVFKFCLMYRVWKNLKSFLKLFLNEFVFTKFGSRCSSITVFNNVFNNLLTMYFFSENVPVNL